jgi:hypothetical protein
VSIGPIAHHQRHAFLDCSGGGRQARCKDKEN